MERSTRATTPRPALMRRDLEQSLMRRSINPLTLSAFQRILLTTDGTVTEILEAFSGESIHVVKLFQEVSVLDRAISALELPWGQHVLRRNILLQGRMSLVNFIYAESVIALDRLDEGVRDGLLQSKKPIGLLILERRIETFREILDCGRERAGALARHFPIGEDASLIFRSYRVIAGGHPIMLITEKFPESYFRDWDPTGTWGAAPAPDTTESARTPEQGEAELKRTVAELEHFLRHELPGNNHHGPIAPDAALLEGGIIDPPGFFALLAFITERFGVKFDDDELVAENFRTLGAIAQRIAEARAQRRHGGA
jgi:chorismate-pyruvate lyase/acyl carrier protein